MTAVAHAYSAEAEAAVLGAILLRPKKVLGPVRELLRPADFFAPQAQLVYAAMLEIDASGQPLDTLTLLDHLSRREQLARVGGPEYLAELAGRVPTSENVAYHAQIVAEKSLTRQIKVAAARVQASGAVGQELLQEALSELGLIQLPQLSQGESLREALMPALNAVEKGNFLGLPTHLVDLDRILGGIQRGVECIIAARPGMGKSSLVAGIAQATAEHGGTVDYYPIEDGKRSLTLRMIAQRGQVNNQKLRSAQLNASEWAHVNQAASSLYAFGERLEIFENAPTDDAEVFCLQAKHRALKKRATLKSDEEWRHLIIVDYLQLLYLREFRGKGNERNAELSRINRLLKALPAECDCHLIVCSQLKRIDGEPQLSDLRDSGAIEQDAHQVVMLDRPPWLCDADGEAIPACWAHVRKNKDGAPGTVPLSWRGEYVLFGDADEETKRMAWAAHRAQAKKRRR